VTALARILARQHRFEIVAILLVTAMVAGAALVVGMRLRGLEPTDACVDAWLGLGSDGVPCAVEAWLALRNGEAGLLSLAILAAPFLVGAVAGAVLLAREIELGTAALGWALQPRRSRWLAPRIAAALLLVTVSLAAIGIAGRFLWSAADPAIDPAASFARYGLDGPLVVARGVAAFAIAVLAGAVVGRQLPTSIVALGLVVALWPALQQPFPWGAPVTWVPLDVQTSEARSGGRAALSDPDRIVGYGFQSADGVVRSFTDAAAAAPAGLDEDALDAWVRARTTEVVGIVPGTEAGSVALRESLALTGVALAALAGSFLVIGRRRP